MQLIRNFIEILLVPIDKFTASEWVTNPKSGSFIKLIVKFNENWIASKLTYKLQIGGNGSVDVGGKHLNN